MRYLAILMTALTVMLTGCATTISSDVTAFHEWPASLQDKSYVFVTPSPENDTLEYRNYQNLVRAELAKQGFGEASGPDSANLRVSMGFSTTDFPERVLQAADPFFYGPGYWPGRYATATAHGQATAASATARSMAMATARWTWKKPYATNTNVSCA